MKRASFSAAVILLILSVPAEAQRNQIRIVGSSTVYPFATKVAESFGRTSEFKTPVIESTGSGGGFKLFCAGVGSEHPDITNASRAIKDSEVELCAKNGVKEITEVKIGYDGIVLANSRKAGRLKLTRKQIFQALAKEIPGSDGSLKPNPYRTWRDVDSTLPEVKIEVLGPPPTSGTRDAFVELAMEGGCKSWDWVKDLKKADKGRYQEICHTLREDGAYVEAGENDNLIVQKLDANPNSLGIFGFSFLDQNQDRVQGSFVDGVEPTFDNIALGDYPVSRPLFFYVKKAHAGVIPGIQEFVQAFASDSAWGPDGYLADAGLIPMPAQERSRLGSEVRRLAANVR
ncbi:MAG: PstS family phosphate ABC transporter substrate-binding protein [Deltaproteobacteria bacterium]|nr:PstS family phosphate ABC transporter substrate-binding protein [Deltaproteobacteria bacterium]